MAGELVLRRMRRRRMRGGLSLPARIGALLVVLATLTVGGLAAGIGRLYLELTQQVPAVADMESFFREAEPAGLLPTRVVDPNGDLLLSVENPAAENRLWVGLQASAPVTAPSHLVAALLVRQNPGFWESPGYDRGRVLVSLMQDALGRTEGDRRLSVTEQLVAATLLPVERYGAGSVRRDFRLALLAERLTSTYDKSQILTWYLNSADFGHYAYGVDAAALVYFGKHADGLTLAESALMAAMPGRADELLADPDAARDARRETLAALYDQGAISRRQEIQAQQEPIELQRPSALAIEGSTSLARDMLREVETRLGGVWVRGGLTIVSTIQSDLQQQAACTLRAQVGRLNGGDPSGQPVAAPGVPCLASGLLPLMRPGDTGIDHAVTAASILILSPADGSVLAAVDLAGESGGAGIESAQPGGKMLYPFVYLTAFSRGLSPGSMVLDLPTEANAPSAALAQYHGPERMRTALANGDRAATVRAIDLAGAANIRRTLQELGLIEAAQSVDDEMLADGSIDTSLLDLSYSYSTLANQGLMVSADLEQPGPSLVRSIQDRFERSRYDNQRQTKVVLGEGLSYLLLDVLTDESAADVPTSLVGTSTIGRPVGWLHAETGDGTSWSVLFTPSLLVGVRIDSEPAAAEKAATVDNASDPLATAVMRYASSDRTPAGWVEPPEVEEVEVCDPSGLLPTEYCPEVVREVFLQGTEPSALDNLYQPFRVNRETGRLATLQTPLELIEERVYLVPPPEAAQWASQAGIQQPPTEYDPLSESASDHPDVTIESPNQFATVGGEVVVRGQVHPDDLDYYRLQVGRGLNPTRWTQIGSDSESRAWGGVLAKWDTSALSGLYTLQLVAVLQNGQIISAAAPVTIDNQPPAVAIRRPTAGAEITGGLTVEVDVEDDSMIDWVDVYLDGRKRARLREAPYAWEGSTLAAGEHVIQVRAADIAGNQGESALLQVQAGD